MSKPSSNEDLDLHGFTVAEAIESFVRHYNARVENNQLGCWRIIHGYGSTGQGGAIRIKLRAFLDQHLDRLRYEPGDSYGDPGWTFIYPKLPLPDEQERMATAILSFCSGGKTEEKILREFPTLGVAQLRQTVRSLLKRGKLKEVIKGAKISYRAVQ